MRVPQGAREPRRATFDDLLGTGNLRVIRDGELRAEVVEYYDLTGLRSMHDLIRREIWYGYRESVDEVLDPLVMAEITRIEREVDRDLDRLVAGIDGSAVAAGLNLTALRSSDAFRAGIGGALEYTLVQRDQYRQRARSPTRWAEYARRWAHRHSVWATAHTGLLEGTLSKTEWEGWDRTSSGDPCLPGRLGFRTERWEWYSGESQSHVDSLIGRC